MDKTTGDDNTIKSIEKIHQRNWGNIGLEKDG
jgi:hypothetical protein